VIAQMHEDGEIAAILEKYGINPKAADVSAARS
jgi:hypothetical protein